MKWKEIIKNPWVIAITVALIFFLLGLPFYKNYIQTKGNYNPRYVKGNYKAGDQINGDKIINYGTFIKNEVSNTNKDNIVTEEKIKDFFLRLQLSLSEKRKSIPLQELSILPGYLQIPYDMHITISKTHGIGYEFITPSDNPRINISTTNMPIEEYYFSKYTDKKHFSKATAMRINAKYIVLANLGFIAGKKVIAVSQRGNVLLKNIGIQYSKEDSIKEVKFLRIFGNNQEDFWKQMDPIDEATFLFNVK